MKVEKLKSNIIREIDKKSQSFAELTLKIHAHPELGFKEVKASNWLTQCLEENDFSIEKGICGLDTAFKARYGQEKPRIAILAEYDALPNLGHACGHNLIGTCAVAAGVAARQAIDQFGGSILIIGTPAEELYGGKIIMAKREAFKDLDAAMMVHPGTRDNALTRALACQGIEVEFIGKAAHAAARPEDGVNALEAMLQSFVAINSLRQHIWRTSRIHGIITDGGEAPNVVPARSAGTFLVRTRDDAYLDQLKEKVLNCFIGAATASGAELKYKWDDERYAPMRNNMPLAHLFAENMQSLERKVALRQPDYGFGSTDMGNVSQLVPSIHPHVSIAKTNTAIHSPEFAEAAASEKGIKGMLDSAKTLAMIVADLVANPDTIASVKEDFEHKI
ncbi:M20 family metallopeptidase [Chloroflexota bacterium]